MWSLSSEHLIFRGLVHRLHNICMVPCAQLHSACVTLIDDMHSAEQGAYLPKFECVLLVRRLHGLHCFLLLEHRMLRRLRRGCSLGGHGCLQLCHHLPGVNRVDLAVGTARGRSRQSASRRPMRFSNRPSAHHRQPLGSASTWSSSEKSTSAGFSSLDCAASARAAMSSGAISDARCHNHNTSTGLRAWVLLSANGYICGIAASCNMHFTGFRLGASSAVDGASVTSSWASQQD